MTLRGGRRGVNTGLHPAQMRSSGDDQIKANMMASAAIQMVSTVQKTAGDQEIHKARGEIRATTPQMEMQRWRNGRDILPSWSRANSISNSDIGTSRVTSTGASSTNLAGRRWLRSRCFIAGLGKETECNDDLYGGNGPCRSL